MNIIRNAAIVFAATLAMSTSAYSADEPFSQEEIASAFDVAFGATVTSRYMSRGSTLSDGVALQGYIEPSYGMFYAGVWFSTIDGALGGYSLNDDVEFNLYAGIRPEFGNLSLDFGYTRFIYDSSGDDCRCGELHAKATYAFNDIFSAGGEIYYDPKWETTYGVVNGSVALPYDFTFSAAFGGWLESGNNDHDWNAGLSYTFKDTITIDGRYHDSNHSPSRFVVSVSFDTSWSALRGR